MSDLTWTNSKRKLSELVPWERNPRQVDEAQRERLAHSWDKFGQVQTLAIGPNNELYDGHQREKVLSALDRYGPDYEVDVRVASRPLTDRERRELTVLLVKASGDWDWSELGTWDQGDLLTWGFEEGEFRFNTDSVDSIDYSSDEQDIYEQFMILIECSSEAHQTQTLEKLSNEGYKCRALLS